MVWVCHYSIKQLHSVQVQPMIFYITVEVNNTLYIAQYSRIMIVFSRPDLCVDNTALIN